MFHQLQIQNIPKYVRNNSAELPHKKKICPEKKNKANKYRQEKKYTDDHHIMWQ